MRQCCPTLGSDGSKPGGGINSLKEMLTGTEFESPEEREMPREDRGACLRRTSVGIKALKLRKPVRIVRLRWNEPPGNQQQEGRNLETETAQREGKTSGGSNLRSAPSFHREGRITEQKASRGIQTQGVEERKYNSSGSEIITRARGTAKPQESCCIESRLLQSRQRRSKGRIAEEATRLTFRHRYL
jgi:hypothetical protein